MLQTPHWIPACPALPCVSSTAARADLGKCKVDPLSFSHSLSHTPLPLKPFQSSPNPCPDFLHDLSLPPSLPTSSCSMTSLCRPLSSYSDLLSVPERHQALLCHSASTAGIRNALPLALCKRGYFSSLTSQFNYLYRQALNRSPPYSPWWHPHL